MPHRDIREVHLILARGSDVIGDTVLLVFY